MMMLQPGDDYNAETLLQKLGLADLVEYSDAKIRCIIPISDALEEANTGDNGTHWSLMILEITKTSGLNELSLRGMHFNSLRSSNHKEIADGIRDKICSLMSGHLPVAFPPLEEAADMPQQSDGFSCADRVIHGVACTANVPFDAPMNDFITSIKYERSPVSDIRNLLKDCLDDAGIERVLNESHRRYCKFEFEQCIFS